MDSHRGYGPKPYDATGDPPAGRGAPRITQASSGASVRVAVVLLDPLSALRLALLDGRIDTVTYRAVVEYVSPVPLFSSGNEAAAHGESGIETPDERASRLINKITRARNDLVQ
ncbi:DUF6283 family protein [Streptomyces bobili]|uniref:DUF6283 family protein n=1 Tax=Streptomyces bobili TaxID=67280 RepID=UPI00371458A5